MARLQRRTVRHVPRIYGDLRTPKRDWSKAWRGLRIIALLLFIYGLYFFLFQSSVFAVKNVEVQGAQVSESKIIEALVPIGGNIWRFPIQDVSEEIRGSQPVLSVQILKGIPDTIRVVVTERTPVLRWQTGETVFLLDAEGIAFMQYPASTPPSLDSSFGLLVAELPLVSDTTQLPVQEGDVVVGFAFEQFVSELISDLKNYFPVYSLEFIEIGETSYDITLVFNSGMRVQMNSLAKSDVQVRNLARLQRDGKLQPTSLVDLRIDRWAYVR